MGGTPAPPSRASRTPAKTKGREQPGPSIVIPVTQGNLNNNHVYLRSHLDFFPADAVGGRSKEDGLGRSLTVHFQGQADPVETDIAGGNKLLFRARSPWRAFFSRHRLEAGDSLTIVRLSDYQYRVEASPWSGLG